MNKKFTSLGLMLGTIISTSLIASPTPKPRTPETQKTLKELQAIKSTNQAVIKFADGFMVRIASNGSLTGLSPSQIKQFVSVLKKYGGVNLRRMFSASEEHISKVVRQAQKSTDTQLTDLNLYFLIDAEDSKVVADLSNALGQLKYVEYSEPVQKPVPPPYSPADFQQFSATEDFTKQQGYLLASPAGINLPDRSVVSGIDGEGIKVVDVEYGWLLVHEDLGFSERNLLAPADYGRLRPEYNFSVPGKPLSHGTAAIGIIGAKDNSFGMTGIAPKVELFGSPQSYWDPSENIITNKYDAVMRAIIAIDNGDILLMENQTRVCGTDDLGPSEWDRVIYDLLEVATAEGIVVVAAAGNGGVNLDDPTCQYRFNRMNDSGSIIVGASYSTVRVALPYSSYGSRVNVHSWGVNVATLGYGDLFPGTTVDIFDEFDTTRKDIYTGSFEGTSSATPIVAGAAAVIQSRLKFCERSTLKSEQMRELLSATGTPQTFSDPHNIRHIGPQPDVEKALNKIEVLDFCLNLETNDPGLLFEVDRTIGTTGLRRTVILHNRNSSSVRFKARLRNPRLRTFLSVSPSIGAIPANGSVTLTVSLPPMSSINLSSGRYTSKLVVSRRFGSRQPYTEDVTLVVNE